jgi:hypothetical protein
MTQQIEVTVSVDGDVQVAVKGVCGTGCADLTKSLEQDLGLVVSDKPTPEMFQQEKIKRTI